MDSQQRCPSSTIWLRETLREAQASAHLPLLELPARPLPSRYPSPNGGTSLPVSHPRPASPPPKSSPGTTADPAPLHMISTSHRLPATTLGRIVSSPDPSR